jgi:MoaA/NifB/PqqE/SkfB family radical SAM enzyme/polysaccharide pyruvyl transferase WcaK-like protein
MTGPGAVGAYLWRWATGPAGLGRSPGLPRVLNLPVTDNCNSRCVMCDLWKERSTGELAAADYRRVLSDRLFARVAHVGISGGEPSLRRDLPELVEAVLGALPRLRSLSITTHGFLPRVWRRTLEAMGTACRARGVSLTLNLSLDGVGGLHDRVRGIPGGWERWKETRGLAAELGVAVQLQATVCAPNVYGVGRILQYANDQATPVVFRQATAIERLRNRESIQSVSLGPGEASYLADWLGSSWLHGSTRSPARRLFYRDLSRRLARGGPRRAPCHFQGEGVLLDPHGELYYCSISTTSLGNALRTSARELYFAGAAVLRDELLRGLCPRCVHDQSGTWSPWAVAAEVLRGTAWGRRLFLGAEAGAMGLRYARLAARGRQGPKPAQPPTQGGTGGKALVLGAYGGEHVGDAAILGGVILRLRDRGVAEVRVASFRPDRTRRWLASLDVPLPVQVVDVGAGGLGEELGPGDWVVHGGGPVMDLPRVLLRELEVVERAHRRGARLVLEGVGVGPFRRRWSRRLARRLLLQSEEVRVRSAADARHPLLQGLAVRQGEDPAFDYLRPRAQARPEVRLPPAEAAAVDAAVAARDGSGVTVGLNLRPLWDRYVAGRGASAARLEERLLDELLVGMQVLERARAGRSVRWTLFAMNADQLGFSDFRPAWRLLDRAAGHHDLALVEHELGVDALAELVRRLDAVVAMRLHANIFAMALDVPCLGVDYAVGEPGKIAALFAERGHPGRCSTIESFTGGWMASRLEELIP